MTLEELQGRFDRMANLKRAAVSIEATNADTGKVIRVLEFGSVSGQSPWPHPGPKTVLAVNPDTGAQIVVSAKMPTGFVRMQAKSFVSQLKNTLAGGNDWLDATTTNEHLDRALEAAGNSTLAALRHLLSQTSSRIRDALRVNTE